MSAPADPDAAFAGVDFARGVACNTHYEDVLSARVRERVETRIVLPAKPTARMLIAASLTGGVSVSTAAAMYLAMTKDAAMSGTPIPATG